MLFSLFLDNSAAVRPNGVEWSVLSSVWNSNIRTTADVDEPWIEALNLIMVGVNPVSSLGFYELIVDI